MIVQPLIHWFQANAPVLKQVGVALTTISGWLVASWKWWGSRQMKIVLEQEGTIIFLRNYGVRAVEVLGVGITLREDDQKPDLAKKHVVSIPLTCVVQPNERKSIVSLAAQFLELLEDIVAPKKRAVESDSKSWISTYVVRADFSISCSHVGKMKPQLVVLPRYIQSTWARASQPYIWHLGYDAHIFYRRTLWRWLVAGTQSFGRTVRHPLKTFGQWRKLRHFGVILHVEGILQAVQNKVITYKEAERRLQRLAVAYKKKPEELLLDVARAHGDDEMVADLERALGMPNVTRQP